MSVVANSTLYNFCILAVSNTKITLLQALKKVTTLEIFEAGSCSSSR